MRSWFRVDTPGRAYAWLLGFGVARTVLDFFWVPQNSQPLFMVLTLFNTTTYQFTLSLFIPWIVGFILERVFSKRVNAAGVLRDSVLVWAVFPAVSILSMVLKSPPTQTIEWFRHIPTLMVEYNFLPAGMIAVTPIVVIVYTRLFVRHSGAGLPTAFIAVVWALLVHYLVYYQYTARPFLYLLFSYGPIFAFGFYNLTCLIPLFPLAKRFHQAFGPHPFTLPRLVPIWSLLSMGLMLGALPSVLSPGPLAGPPPVTPQPVVRWNLRMFQLYDRAGTMAAYGYYLDLSAVGRPVRVFRLFQPQSFFFPNLEYVTSDAGGLSYRDLLDIRMGRSKLTFDWNRSNASGDPILESLRGTDSIIECSASLEGEEYSCFMLDETLTTDVLKRGTWPSETFVAVSGTDLSLIAFSVGDYTDGIIALRNRRHWVTSVTRQDSEVRIAFQGGTAVVDCTLLGEYETMRVVEPQPVDSPARCEVIIRPDRGPEITTTVDGLLERIGTTQGTGE